MSAKKYLDHTGLQYYDSKLKSYVAGNYLPLTGGIEMPTNPFGGKRLYINSIDNAFANADKKFYVTITKHKKTDNGVTYPYVDTSKARTDDNYYVDGPVVATLTSSASLLFNGDYENSIDLESNGTTYLKVRIMFGSNTSPSASTSYFSGYPYGYWYLSYYYTSTPNANSQARVYNKYSGHTVGWNLYTSTFYNGSPSSVNVIQKIADEVDYQRTCVDFIIYGNDTSGRAVSLTQIEYQLVRPNLSRDGSTVTKYGDQNLYSSFTWYQNHTQVARIASDGTIYGTTLYENGTSLANKYLQKSGGTISSGSNSDPLAIKGLGDTYLRFENSSGTILGYLGVNSSKQPVFYDTSSHRLALYSELPSIVDDMDPGLAPKLPAGDPQVGTNVLTASGGTPQWVTGILTDTTYESKTAASGGTDVSLVTTGEKYTWNNKVDTSPFLEAFISSSAAIMGNQMLVIDSEGDFSWIDTHPSAASGGTTLSLVTTGEKYTWNNKGTYSKPNGGIPDSDLASTFVKVASQTLTDAQKTQARTNIGAGTSSLAIGTTATTAAAGNHTHTTSIEIGGSGTAFDLSYGTKYTLSAGGNTFVFKTPALGSTSTTAAAGDHTHSQYLTTAVTKLGTRTGDITLANLKSDLGLGSAAYADSTDFSLVGHTHSYLPLSGGTLTGDVSIKGASKVSFINTSSSNSNIQIKANTTSSTNGNKSLSITPNGGNNNSIIFNFEYDSEYGGYVNSVHPDDSEASLGTSDYPWGYIYGTAIYEDGTSLTNKYAAINHTHAGILTPTQVSRLNNTMFYYKRSTVFYKSTLTTFIKIKLFDISTNIAPLNISDWMYKGMVIQFTDLSVDNFTATSPIIDLVNIYAQETHIRQHFSICTPYGLAYFRVFVNDIDEYDKMVLEAIDLPDKIYISEINVYLVA